MSSWTQQKQLKRWVGAVNDMILTCIWLFLWIALIGGSRVLRFTFNTFGETSGSIKAAWVERRRQMSWTEAISQMAISICHVQFLPLSFCTVENNEFVASIIIRFDGSKTNQEKKPYTELGLDCTIWWWWWLSLELLFRLNSLFMILWYSPPHDCGHGNHISMSIVCKINDFLGKSLECKCKT